jgi:Ca-activated chloride channel family protein
MTLNQFPHKSNDHLKRVTVLLPLLLIALLIASGCSSAITPQPVPAVEKEVIRTVQVERVVEAEMQAADSAGLPEALQHTNPNEEPYDTVFYKNYGVNPAIDTEDDHLSTFAMDVDTGSYTIARRYVRDGYLPPEDAIRVEEFVNYFDQDYAYPPEGEAFALYMDGAPTPFTENERYQMLRVGVQGYAVAPEDRKDVALTFVIDVSGSMDRENRLGLVKESLALLVEQLRPTDSVAIVVYGSRARVVLEPASGANQAEILQAINRLEPDGSTNAEEGLRIGYDLALDAFKPDGINRVILASDGVANVGRTSAGSIWDVIKAKASEGVTLTTVGFGMGNYNDVLMEQLADQGDGFYAYVDTLREAERLFVYDLTGTLQVIALDAKVQVDFDPDVVARYRLVGFENRAVADDDFRNDSVDAGEIGAGHNVTALYEIKLHPDATGRIATAFIRWEDPDTHEVVELSRAYYSDETAPAFSDASARFQLDIIVAEYAEILRGSYWAQESSLAAVLEEAQRVSRLLEEDVEVAEFTDLVSRSAQISQGE